MLRVLNLILTDRRPVSLPITDRPMAFNAALGRNSAQRGCAEPMAVGRAGSRRTQDLRRVGDNRCHFFAWTLSKNS